MDDPEYLILNNGKYIAFRTLGNEVWFIIEGRKFNFTQLDQCYNIYKKYQEESFMFDVKIFVNQVQINMKLVKEMLNWAK